MANIKERDLLKALNDLEDLVAKGDALENADTEGGFSTEGKPLSNQAPSGRSDALKGDLNKMLSASDVGSDAGSDYGSAMKKKTKKAMPPMKGDDADSASSDDGSSDGGSDDASEGDDSDSGDDASSPMGKSFTARAQEDETMRKAIEVSDFIEAMVDQTSNSLSDLQKSIGWIAGQLDERIAKSEAAQQNFNSRLAKAVVQIGNSVNGLSEVIGRLSGMPNLPQRRAVLSKSEIVDPHLGGQPSGGDLGDVSSKQIQDWLFEKSMRNEIDPVMVTVFEQNGYNPEVLPVQVRKALINDLHK